MARLPQPGGDSGNWGAILNDYLNQSHNTDGSLKDIPQSKVTNLTTNLGAKLNTTDLDAQTAAKVTTGGSATETALSATYAKKTEATALSVDGTFQPDYDLDTTPPTAGDVGAYTQAEVNNLITDAVAGVQAVPYDSLWRVGNAETFGRMFANGSVPATGSGILWLSYFQALSNSTITKLGFGTAGSAGSGLTLARLGLYTANANGSATLVARTASDTTLGNAAYSQYERTLSTVGGYPASYQFVKGQLYTIGFIQVGTTASSIVGGAITNYTANPVITRNKSGQTDLPASVAAGENPHYGSAYFYGLSA
jgi:hypothetical protein